MSRADLFLVCKNPECGAEVSPYVTECPYCGTRLQKRAPKLDKGLQPARTPRRMPAPSLGRLRPGEIPGIRAERGPYVTGTIIVSTAAFWIATRAGWLSADSLVARGPLAAHWSRLFSAKRDRANPLTPWPAFPGDWRAWNHTAANGEARPAPAPMGAADKIIVMIHALPPEG